MPVSTCEHCDDSINERDDDECSIQSVPVIREVIVVTNDEAMSHRLHHHLTSEDDGEHCVAGAEDSSLS